MNSSPILCNLEQYFAYTSVSRFTNALQYDYNKNTQFISGAFEDEVGQSTIRHKNG